MTLSQACRRLKAADPSTRERLLDRAPPGLVEALIKEFRQPGPLTRRKDQCGPLWRSRPLNAVGFSL